LPYIERGLLQLRVLRRGLLQDGDVGPGIFPEDEEVVDTGLVPRSALRSSRGFAGDEEKAFGLGIAFERLEMGTTSGDLAGVHLDYA
jgi:hypothetical protein